MTSSSCSFGLVSMLFVLQFLLVPGSVLASTKYIDDLCHFVQNRTFCLETLTAYPPAVSATDFFPLVETVFRLGRSHAEKTAAFAVEAAKTASTLKTPFKLCNETYVALEGNLIIAINELKEDPDMGNYDVMLCYDTTHYVKDLIGKNKDKASKRLMDMTLQMEKLIEILVGATNAWKSRKSQF